MYGHLETWLKSPTVSGVPIMDEHPICNESEDKFIIVLILNTISEVIYLYYLIKF